MKMRWSHLASIFLTVSSMPWALAGLGSTGGGMSVVCRDNNHEIKSATLLDLYEAKTRDLQLLASTGSVEGDYLQAVKNMWRLQGADHLTIEPHVRENLNGFLRKLKFVNTPLELLNDAGETAEMPKGCTLEQLAVFRDYFEPGDRRAVPGGVYAEDRIFVSTEIWNALSPLDKAALLQHELLYKESRWKGETTSERARYGVGLIFSSYAETVNSGLAPEDKLYIAGDPRGSDPTDRSDFWVAKAPNGVVLQFRSIMGRILFSKTTAAIQGIDWRLNSDGLGCIVMERDKSVHARVPLVGIQSNGLELEVSYVTGRSVKLGLYQKGVLIRESVLSSCR